MAQELLGTAEPELCEEAEDEVAPYASSATDLDFADVTDETQAVGRNAQGETVILLANDDEGVIEFLETAYPGAHVEAGIGELTSLAGIKGDVVGGAGIYSLVDGGGVALCSLGFPAWTADGAPAAVTAGHCTNDGALTGVGLTDPRGDDAAGGDNLAPGDDLGSYGFSQFGGPGNAPEVNGTDIAVINVDNEDLNLVPAVTDWSTPDELSASTSPITSVGSVDPSGSAIERSGRTTGYSSAPASQVDLTYGYGQVEDRIVRGFWIEGLDAAEGDSGGPVYQDGKAIGLVSGGSDSGVWAADLVDALSYLDGYSIQLHVDVPEMTSPGNDGTVEAGGEISGSAPSGTTLVVTPADGDPFEVEVDDSGQWSFQAPEDTVGEYAFTVMATKGFDQSEEVEYEVEVTLPAPAFTSPVDGDEVIGSIQDVSGTGFEGATVTLQIDGEDVGTAEVSDGEWSIDVDLSYGKYTLSASQELDGETSADAQADVSVAPSSPTIIAPEDGASFEDGEAPGVVEGTGLDGATVTLQVDGEDVGTAEVADGEWSIEISGELAAGDHELAAVQTIDGVSSGAHIVEITVNEPPEAPEDEDSDDETGEDDGNGDTGGTGEDDGEDKNLPTLPETGVDSGTTTTLITAALLIMAGVATRIWRRVVV